MVMDYQQQQLRRLHSALSVLVYPIQFAVDLPGRILNDVGVYFSTRSTLMKENKRLNDEKLALRRQIQRLSALEAENTRLKILLKTSARPGDKVAIAEVMQVDLDPFKQRVLINRGSLDGIYEGQPVVDSEGIIGQVVNVGPMTSVILLVTDSQHAIPVQSERSGARAIATGSGEPNTLLLQHVTITSDFKIGDKIISSGLGQRFPKGYPVGEVISIDNDAGEKFAQVMVQPYGQTQRVREILLIWPEGLTADVLVERAKEIEREKAKEPML